MYENRVERLLDRAAHNPFTRIIFPFRPTHKTCHSFQTRTPISMQFGKVENPPSFQPHYSNNKRGITVMPPVTTSRFGSARIFGWYRRSFLPFLIITSFKPFVKTTPIPPCFIRIQVHNGPGFTAPCRYPVHGKIGNRCVIQAGISTHHPSQIVKEFTGL